MSGRVLDELAARYRLDRRRVWQRDRLAASVTEAVEVLGSPALVVDAVVQLGELRGARDPWAVILGRLRRVVDDAASRQAVSYQAGVEADGDGGCPVPESAVLDALADRLGLDVSRIGRPDRLAASVTEAVEVLGSPALVVDAVVQLGELRGARDPWAVILGRLRRLPALAAARQRARDDRAEQARWREVDRAVLRGEKLRTLVDRELLHEDEAVEQLAAELPDSELLAVAVAALTGGGAR